VTVWKRGSLLVVLLAFRLEFVDDLRRFQRAILIALDRLFQHGGNLIQAAGILILIRLDNMLSPEGIQRIQVSGDFSAFFKIQGRP